MKALAILLARANFTCLVAAQFQLASARGAQPCKGVEFSLAMEIYVGEISAFLSLNVISDSTYTLALVAESLDTCPRIPVYVNTTSPGHPGSTSQPPAGALNFDLTNSSTAPEVKTRGVYGIIMPTPADKSPGSSLVINALWGGQDFGWFVDAIISRMYYAFTGNENQNFFACNTTINGRQYLALSWGVYKNDQRDAPDGCQVAMVYQNFDIEGGGDPEDQMMGKLHC